MLASTSRYRAELLARLELPFDTRAPDFDERAHDHRFAELAPHEFALTLARGKAESLRAELPRAWILAADQIAVIDRPEGPELLHKPETVERAVAQLMQLRGRTHRLITAVVLQGDQGFERHAIDEQRLYLRAFGEAEARAYVERHRPLDCVGSYRIEDAGIKLFERIEGGDFTGIMGLPLLSVCSLLREAGLLVA